MKQTCVLADTGMNLYLIIGLICLLAIFSGGIAYFVYTKRNKPYGAKYLLFVPLLVLSLVLFTAQPVYAGDDCTGSGTSESPRVWLPSGRFQSEVFDADDIETQHNVYFGTETSIGGDSAALTMTINQPKQSVDSEIQRPLIVALPGGYVLGGACDQTFDIEQEAMLEMARYGYVTATVRQMVDPLFCDGNGAAPSDYEEFMDLHAKVINKAIQYMYDSEETYKIDPDSTGLYGYSIGGQISLLKLRDNNDGAPFVKVIASFAAVTSLPSYDAAFGTIVSPNSQSPKVLMVSYDEDDGFGGFLSPDADGDCANLVSLGYDCTYGEVAGTGHIVHANSTNLSISPGGQPVDEYFREYMYENLVAGD